MTTTTKKRFLDYYKGTPVLRTWTIQGKPPVLTAAPDVPYGHWVDGTQTTVSESHPEWFARKRLLRGNYLGTRDPELRKFIRMRDCGGNFSTSVQQCETSHPEVLITQPYTSIVFPQREYRGPLFALSQGTTIAGMNRNSYPSLSLPSMVQMVSYGTKAIARTIPTNPVAGLATFLGELREGLPKIPGQAVFRSHLRARDRIANVADEHLNVQFGLKPLISDVSSFAGAVKTSKEVIDQYQRDSGRLIRRRYSFPESTETEITDMGLRTTAPAFPSDMYLGSGLGKLTRTRVTHSRIWFSGAYTYYLDPGETAKGKLIRDEQIANKLYGTRVSPEVLWELTPWSWAADYVLNIGDIMTNISALSRDSLVIRHAYVMMETTITDTYVLQGVKFNFYDPGPITQTFRTTVKSRLKATPYGFGLNPASISDRQWGILLALGVSQGHKRL